MTSESPHAETALASLKSASFENSSLPKISRFTVPVLIERLSKKCKRPITINYSKEVIKRDRKLAYRSPRHDVMRYCFG